MRRYRKRIQTSFGPLRIVDAKVDNAEAILNLFSSVVAENIYMATMIEELDRTVQQQEDIIHVCLKNTNCCFMEAYIDRFLIGAMSVWGGDLTRTSHVGTLEIFVATKYRGGGIGEAMMRTLITWATENPVIEKLSLSVFADNLPAIQLYEKLGFAVEGCAVGDFREKDGKLRDRLLMARWCT